MPDRKRNQLLARTAASLSIGLRRVWLPSGGAPNGVEIGVMLTEVYYTPNPYVTTGYIVERLMGAYSVDTIRRRLELMVDDELVEVIEVGGRKLYRACPSAAQRTVDVLLEGVEVSASLINGA